ncbi:MAG: radical SAM protein [Nanoarchaeota archaeon]|nr:radical SAM protein [Nanoarchaeota archaeon]MBU1051184.1 radical SAM protein [Nanoarchaeota archaeon]MBU1988082.1 radical SAM protein [Nanoarchaeota archaeon]
MRSIKIPEEYNYICAFLSMRCNLKCSFCLNDIDGEFSRNKFIELPGEKWIEGLNRIESRPDVPVTFSGGEPFLHPDFIEIINKLKPELNIDILTNLQWGKGGIERFVGEVDPARIKRDAPYAPIRVSYHPEQMGTGEQLVADVRKLQDAGFSIGVWSVLYPSPEQLSAINQMQFRCKDAGVDFRLKEFTGEYHGDFYGDYSKYSRAAFSQDAETRMCRTSELLMGSDGRVYKCHRDLFSEEYPTGQITSPDFQASYEFRRCDLFGQCHPCDVKVKTSHKQELGYTSVEIKNPEFLIT